MHQMAARQPGAANSWSPKFARILGEKRSARPTFVFEDVLLQPLRQNRKSHTDTRFCTVPAPSAAACPRCDVFQGSVKALSKPSPALRPPTALNAHWLNQSSLHRFFLGSNLHCPVKKTLHPSSLCMQNKQTTFSVRS